MPFTPFHWGPSSWVGFLFYRRFHFCAFLIASVIVDVEPLLVLVFRWDYPLHGFFHSFLGGTLVAVPLAFLLNVSQPLMASFMRPFGLEQKASLKGLLVACLLGVYSHVFLDSFLYTDIRPFLPFEWNPFFEKITREWMYSFCLLSFALGSGFYLRRKDKTLLGKVLACCFGFGALALFSLAFYMVQLEKTTPDNEMITLWQGNLSEFNELVEDCNWKHDGPNYEPIHATEQCLKVAKTLGFEGDVYGYDDSVKIGGLYKGYIYSKVGLSPLHENLDLIDIVDIPSYSTVYRKLNDNWYLYKRNPSD